MFLSSTILKLSKENLNIKVFFFWVSEGYEYVVVDETVQADLLLGIVWCG